MTFWLLDDGPLGILAGCLHAAWRWPAATLHIVEEVAEAARQDRSGRRQALLAMCADAGPCIQVHSLPADPTTLDVLYSHLRRRSATATKDLGEDASIAFCMTMAPQAILVALDKRAAFVALAELGPGHVATPFDCWDWLRGEGFISEADFANLCDATLKRDQGLPGLPRRFTRAAR